MLQFLGFPDIEGFHNVVKFATSYPEHVPGVVKYRGKVKIHGTNAGIRLNKEGVAAQSRSQIITPESDNIGFAKWVHGNIDYWKNVWEYINKQFPEQDITIYGEWCGPGIQKGTAINQLPEKIFAIFSIMIGNDDNAKMIVHPIEISDLLPDCPKDIFVIPWYEDIILVKYFDREALQQTVEYLNEKVSKVELCDPWVKDTFKVEGIGEGLVFYPLVDGNLDVPRVVFKNLIFKAKGEKHKVVKTKTAVQIDPEVAKSIDEFVSLFVTQARLEQGLDAVGGVFDLKRTGDFLKWIGQDVLKESQDELEASSLEWDDVQKQIQVAARKWFIEGSKKL